MYPRVRLIFIVYFQLVYWCVFGLKEVYTMTSRPSIVVGRREHHSSERFASTTARVERGSEEETRKLVARSLLPLSDARAIEVCDFDDHFDDLRKDWRNPNFGVA